MRRMVRHRMHRTSHRNFKFLMILFFFIVAFKIIIIIIIDVSSIRACRPRILFINGFLCFLEDEWQWNEEGRERGDATSRRR